MNLDLNQTYIIGGAVIGAIIFIALIYAIVSSRRKRARLQRPATHELSQTEKYPLQTPADIKGRPRGEAVDRPESAEPSPITDVAKIQDVVPSVATAPRTLWSMLARTQEAFTAKLDALVLGEKKIDDEFLDNLEELLYTSDLGPKTVARLLSAVRSKLSRGELQDLASVKRALYAEILNIMTAADAHTHFWGKATDSTEGQKGANSTLNSADDDQAVAASAMSKPWVILVVGVNGVGKTTSIGKLAQYYASQGKKVLVVAGDTFRAAAGEQLAVWGERAQVSVYSSDQTKDSAAVAFQGIQHGVAEGHDVVIVDTAGRLHTKENLMEELKKVKRVCAKALSTAPDEVVLVIDANSGQNAKVQAQQFNDALGLTSLIVTKLDGTARGGIIVSIAEEVGVGVQFIGTGEKLNDLQKFSTDEYAKGLLRI